jgi:hypothetical protein
MPARRLLDRGAPCGGNRMRRALWTSMAGTALLFGAGCATGPLQNNPVLVAPDRSAFENPLFLPQGPPSYNIVFGKVLDTVSDYFEIAYSNRQEGRIESFPRIAPGLLEPWRPGSPDLYQRTLASFQTIRHRAVVLLSAAADGGYFVDVKIYKELEDLDKPTLNTAGAASFRGLTTIERQFEVIDSTAYEPNWIPVGRDGRDTKLEQVILERIAHFDLSSCPRPEDAALAPPPR